MIIISHYFPLPLIIFNTNIINKKSTLFFPGDFININNLSKNSREYFFYKGIFNLFGLRGDSVQKIDLTKAFVYLTISAKMGDLNAHFYLQFMRYFDFGEKRFFKKKTDLRNFTKVKC